MDLEVAETLGMEEAKRVILENQKILTKSLYESTPILQEKLIEDVKEAERHVAPLFQTAKLSIANPEKIVVYIFCGQPFCGVYDKKVETIFAERTITGCDYVSAKEIDEIHNGKVDMGNSNFSGLLSHLMSRARLRIYLGKK